MVQFCLEDGFFFLFFLEKPKGWQYFKLQSSFCCWGTKKQTYTDIHTHK